MRISVITATYNSLPYVREALQSVFAQDHGDVESIVIDGGSTDGTLEAIQSFGDQVAKCISEPDDGIYDALKKGIKIATGDVIAFLHSDDLYARPTVLSDVAQVFEETSTESVYGDLKYVKRDDTSRVVRYWRSGSCTRARLRRGWMPPHPTFMARREVYDKYGAFDTSLRIAADYDLMMRFLFMHQISTAYIPKTLVKMRAGGVSNNSLRNLIRKSREDLIAMRRNGLGSMRTLLWKNVSKLDQFVSR